MASLRCRSRNVLHFRREVASRIWCRERFSIFAIEVDRFLGNLAKFVEHDLFVVAMATAKVQAGRATDITLIFFGPLNDF
jgi:hypothetical protein